MTPQRAHLLSSVGIDPAWSRTLDVGHRVHVLDRPGTDPEAPTVVCLHGNPTWSVLWAPLLNGLDRRHRVVAPDHIDMGHSARVTPPGGVRRYRQRLDDLTMILDACGVGSRLVLMGHDWGGALAAGWAVHHPDRVVGLLLANTGLAVPEGRRAPWLIRLAAHRPLLDLVTRRTPVFVAATPRLPGRPISAAMRAALAAPYRRSADRVGVAGFVADIPFDDSHPTAADLAQVADTVGSLNVPALLVWGGRDPVFNDSFAADLTERIAHAELHRSPEAGHLSPIEVDLAGIAGRWLVSTVSTVPVVPSVPTVPTAPAVEPEPGHLSAWAPLETRATDPVTQHCLAFHDGARDESITFAELSARVHQMAGALRSAGVGHGDRVAVAVPPGIDLVAVVYACWRIGAVTVIADRGLGRRGLGAAVRSARVAAVVGIGRALLASRALGWAPGAILIDVSSLTAGDATGVAPALLGDGPHPDDAAAVLFTSGATGPAKGVRYTHRQLGAQRDALRDLYGIGDDDRLVAAFAPFSLFGPALAIPTAIPDVDVTAPATLTAAALEAACARIGATLVFASPAALTNVLETAGGVATPALGRVRTVMSAGAPIPVPLLERMQRLTPSASLHTPYGMTEVLPVADIDLDTLGAVGPGHGVCVGHRVDGCEVRIDPTNSEVLIAAPWCSAGYDRLADTQRQARPVDPDGRVWHRSGDLGHLDESGRLWIEGRVVHAIRTATSAVSPVPLEVAAERCAGVSRAAAVGVGPAGAQQVVMVVEVTRGRGRGRGRGRRIGLASLELTGQVRAAIGAVGGSPPVAAVLVADRFPVDVRHNSKIDRTLLAARAQRLLAGG